MGHIPRHCKMAQSQRRAGVPRRGPGIQKAYPKSGNLEIGLLPFDSARLCLAGIGLKAHGAGSEKPVLAHNIPIRPGGRCVCPSLLAKGSGLAAKQVFSHPAPRLSSRTGRHGIWISTTNRNGGMARTLPIHSRPTIGTVSAGPRASKPFMPHRGRILPGISAARRILRTSDGDSSRRSSGISRDGVSFGADLAMVHSPRRAAERLSLGP